MRGSQPDVGAGASRESLAARGLGGLRTGVVPPVYFGGGAALLHPDARGGNYGRFFPSKKCHFLQIMSWFVGNFTAPDQPL